MIIMVMDCTFVICFIYDGISSLDFLLAMKNAGIIVFVLVILTQIKGIVMLSKNKIQILFIHVIQTCTILQN